MTDSSNIGQATGGIIVLSDGIAVMSYPIFSDYEPDSSVMAIDTDDTREARVTVDTKISITKDNYRELFIKPEIDEEGYYLNLYDDPELEYVLKHIH